MKTMKQKVNIMQEVNKLAKEWLGYVKDFGNECAYTDSILELIQKKVNELE